MSDHGFTAIVMTGELAGAVSSATRSATLFSAGAPGFEQPRAATGGA